MDLTSIGRAARAAVFAAVCLVLTVAGHSLAEGHQVAPGALAAGFVAVFCLGLAAGGRERSQRAITLCMYAGQLGLHLLFSVGWSLGATAAGAPVMADMPMPMDPMGSMAHSGPAGQLASMSGGTDLPGLAAHSMAAHSGLAMVLAHLGAGAVAGWWLRGGEAVCWRLLRRVEATAAATVRATVRRIVAGPGFAAPARRWCLPTALTDGPGSPMSVRLTRCSPRRGPPAGATPVPSAR